MYLLSQLPGFLLFVLRICLLCLLCALSGNPSPDNKLREIVGFSGPTWTAGQTAVAIAATVIAAMALAAAASAIAEAAQQD